MIFISILEKNTLFRSSDPLGNDVIHYPVTKVECVKGFDEYLGDYLNENLESFFEDILDDYVSNCAYLDLSLTCVPSSANVALAGILIKDDLGSIVFEGAFGSDAIKRINIPRNSTLSISFSNPSGFSLGGDGFTFSTDDSLEKVYSFSETFFAKYGFILDQTESSPFDNITYINDNANFTPVTVNLDSGVPDYGSWNSFIEHLSNPCVLNFNGTVAFYLDRNDQTKKVDGSSYTLGSTQNMMVEFRKLWVKKVDGDIATFEYSFTEFDGATCWTWANGETTRADFVYYAMYKGYTDSNGYSRSMVGVEPAVLTSTQTEMDTIATNGSGWYHRTYLMHNLLEEMVWLLGKSTNSQATFGEDYTNPMNTANSVTGSTVSCGAITGFSDSTKSVKFLYIENLWGNVRERLMGMICGAGTSYDVWYKKYPPFNLTAEGYVKSASSVATSSGYATKFSFTNEYNHFTESGGSTTTYFSDYCRCDVSAIGYYIPVAGGTCTASLNAGVSCWACAHLRTYTATNIGCSPHFIPPSTE